MAAGPGAEARGAQAPGADAVAKTVPGRFAGLDAYRGLAALAVVAYHIWMHAAPWPDRLFHGTFLEPVFGNLEAGVAVFFALSGFLIFLPFARSALEPSSRPKVGRFLLRRAARILPLYYAAFLTVWLLRFRGGADAFHDLWLHLAFLHGFSQQFIFWTVGPAWSLAVEVLFYLLLAGLGPITWLACRNVQARRSRIVLALLPAVLMAAVSLWYKADALYVRHVPLDHWPVYFGFLARMDAFAFGMALAVTFAALGPRRMPRAAAWSFRAGGLAILWFAFATRHDGNLVDLYFHSLSALAATLVMAPTVFRPASSWWESALASRPLAWLGTISYSVYLWHEAILVELAKRGWLLHEGAAAFWPNLALMLVLSVAAGSASYVLIERPVQRLSRRSRRSPSPPEQFPASVPSAPLLDLATATPEPVPQPD